MLGSSNNKRKDASNPKKNYWAKQEQMVYLASHILSQKITPKVREKEIINKQKMILLTPNNPLRIEILREGRFIFFNNQFAMP